MKIRQLLALTTAMSVGMVISTAANADTWFALDLGTLGGTVTNATGINYSGQVVGWSNTAENNRHAFMTGPNGVGMTDLGTLGGTYSAARGINDSGQVVGGYGSIVQGPGYTYGTGYAFITGPNGVGMTNLGTFGGIGSEATGINSVGQVVGTYLTNVSGNGHAFITGPNGVGMTDLGTFGGTSSTAYGINDSGQVVGYADTARSTFNAFITGPNGVGMTDLGVWSSEAHDVNSSGQVAGYFETFAGGQGVSYRAFITGANGVGMTDLGNFGGKYSSANGINDNGQVVG